MGAGASSLTEETVKDIIEDEVDLTPYAKTSDYTKTSDLKGYLSPQYVDEGDKADPVSTDINNESKWVTPKYVNAKIATGNVDPAIVARNLATVSGFQPIITTALEESGAFQSGVARNLATEGSFQTAIWNQLSSSTPAGNNFRELLINQMKGVSEFKGARGEKGIDGSFNLDSMTKEIWDPQDNSTTSTKGWLTMWCADGNICKVPPKRGGIEFTSGDQVIRGFGSGTTPKIVKIEDHLGLKPGNEINFIVGGDKNPANGGSYGSEDGRIKVRESAGNSDDAIASAELEITGIGKRLGTRNERMPRKIKMYDNVEITGNLSSGKLSIETIDEGNRIKFSTNAANGFAFRRGNSDVAYFGRNDNWNEILGNTHINANELRIGDWSLLQEKGDLYIKKKGLNVARFSADKNDRIRLYKSTDTLSNYFYYNSDHNYGTATGGVVD